MRRFFHSVTSGYLLLAVNTLFVLLQIPLALRYLPREQFGLWALVLQLSGYLQLVDLGMSGSVSRHLIDYKDDPGSGEYGGIIKTAAIVLVTQGLIVLIVGISLVFLGSGFLHINPALESKFRLLMSFQCAMLAASFPARIFDHILVAHQRNDVFNYAQIGLFISNYTVLWISLHNGAGVFSLVYANIAGWCCLLFGSIFACVFLKLLPSAGAWGCASWAGFRELFSFGKDIFWMALGTQMINASQTIVITRTLGLDASGTWAVATRAYTLVTQLVWKPFDFSYAALSEMVVRGERDRLLQRFRNLVVLSSSLSVTGAVIFALCNRPFVALWTHGKVTWDSRFDVLLGIWLIVLTLVHCHSGFVVIAKKIGFMKYIYFVEGTTFLVVGSYATSRYGIAGLLTTSILASLIFSCSYGIWRTVKEFGLTLREVAFRWIIPPLRLLLLLGVVALALHLATRQLPAAVQLIVYVVGMGGAAALTFARFGLTTELRHEILLRIPTRFSRLAVIIISR